MQKIANPADRLALVQEANVILGVTTDEPTPGQTQDNINAIAEARHREVGDDLISDSEGDGPTLASILGERQTGRAPTPEEQAQAGSMFEASEDDHDADCDVTLFGPERYVQRKQESAILRRRRLIEHALQPCDTVECHTAIVDECLHRLRNSSNLERCILAAWAETHLRALNYVDARQKIAGAAGCSIETARSLIAKGHAELKAASREVEKAVSRINKTVKPDLREIEIGSVFDTSTSALAIARLAPDAQRALMRAIETRFATSNMDANDATARSKKIRLLSRGMMMALDELGRSDDPATRDLLGRLEPELAKRLVVMLASLRADQLDGIPADSLTVSQYAELIEEVTRQISGDRKKPARRKLTPAKRTFRAKVEAPMGAQLGA